MDINNEDLSLFYFIKTLYARGDPVLVLLRNIYK